MRPALDSVELPQVQRIRTHDRRALAEHHAPGAEGSVFQDLGRGPTLVTVVGVASGAGALDTVKELYARLRGGAPVPFVADMLTGTQLSRVVVSDLQVSQMAGDSERFVYALTLREYQDVAGDGRPAVDVLAVDTDAAALLDGLVDGIEFARTLASGLQRFVPVLQNSLDELTGLNARLTAT